jgi:hypothetical protein
MIYGWDRLDHHPLSLFLYYILYIAKVSVRCDGRKNALQQVTITCHVALITCLSVATMTALSLLPPSPSGWWSVYISTFPSCNVYSDCSVSRVFVKQNVFSSQYVIVSRTSKWSTKMTTTSGESLSRSLRLRGGILVYII